MSMTKEEAAFRRNMTWEEAARELAKAARNALDEAGPAGPVPAGLEFAEACMMGISLLMRRTIHFNRWKKRWAERKAAVLAEVGEHCNPPAEELRKVEEPEVGGVLGNPPFGTPAEVVEELEGSEG